LPISLHGAICNVQSISRIQLSVTSKFLKCLFIALQQITQGKTSLEQALKLAKKLKKESTSLREFIASTSKELSRREAPAPSKDIEEELTWVKVCKLNVSHAEGHR
jgi:hypothetical protein